jgi:hypothetical protein
MVIPSSRTIAAAALALLSLTHVRAAGAEVPTAADLAACNSTAHQEARSAVITPNASDHQRAERVRAARVGRVEPVGQVIESGDPQIHGMDSEGAKSAAFQAAYRSCMRRKGF